MIVRIILYKADFKELDMDGNPLEAFEAICTELRIEAKELDSIEFDVDVDTVREG